MDFKSLLLFLAIIHFLSPLCRVCVDGFTDVVYFEKRFLLAALLRNNNSQYFIIKMCKCQWFNSIAVNKGEQVDLFNFPPVCLPAQGQNFGGSDGVIAGIMFRFERILNWNHKCFWVCHLLHEELDQSYCVTLFAGWGLANEDVLGGWYYSDVLREAKVANLHCIRALNPMSACPRFQS